MKDETIIRYSVTQYEKKLKIAFWKGMFFGIFLATIFMWLTANAHTPCEPTCGYVTVVDLETGEVTQQYECKN